MLRARLQQNLVDVRGWADDDNTCLDEHLKVLRLVIPGGDERVGQASVRIGRGRRRTRQLRPYRCVAFKREADHVAKQRCPILGVPAGSTILEGRQYVVQIQRRSAAGYGLEESEPYTRDERVKQQLVPCHGDATTHQLSVGHTHNEMMRPRTHPLSQA